MHYVSRQLVLPITEQARICNACPLAACNEMKNLKCALLRANQYAIVEQARERQKVGQRINKLRRERRGYWPE